MRRILSALVLLACLAPVALAGCGGDDESSSPLDAGLAFLPKDAPFAVAIDTDLDGEQAEAIDSVLAKLPLEAHSLRELLRDQLGGARSGVDFEQDVEPILGNPFVVGAIDTSFVRSSTTRDFIAALEATDSDALDDLIAKTGAEETGETAGATKYRDNGAVFAVKDDLLVFAGSEALLDEAIEHADGDDHLDPAVFEDALDGLPDDAAARLYADVEALLDSDPDAAETRRIKWVGALRTLGMTASARKEAIEVEFDLRSDPEGLSDEDLPIAAGDDAPPVISRDGEIGLGIRDPGQIVRFAEVAGQALDPSGFGDYAQAKQTLDARLGISIDDDLIGQLGGDLAASIALDRGFAVRAELEDTAAFERTLEKIADVLPSFATGAGLGAVTIEKPRAGDRFYRLAQSDGDGVSFGVVDDVLVVASDRQRARASAAAQPESVDGAEGAVVLSSDAQELANAVLRRYGDELGLGRLEAFGAQFLTGALEDLTGSVSASTDGLRGRVTLGIE